MDLAEKKKKLEQLRASRLEAQRKIMAAGGQVSSDGAAAVPSGPSTPPPAPQRPSSFPQENPDRRTPPPEEILPSGLSAHPPNVAEEVGSVPTEAPEDSVGLPIARREVTVAAVPRNGFQMLSGWDEEAFHIEEGGGPMEPTTRHEGPRSRAVALLNPSSVLQGASSSPPLLPGIAELSIGTMPHVFRAEQPSPSAVGAERMANRGSSGATSEEGCVAVVVAAVFATSARYADEEAGEGVEGSAVSRMLDRATSHSGFAWGANGAAGWTATSTSGRQTLKFGSELDSFLVQHSPGLVLVWVLLPAVYGEQQQRQECTGPSAAVSDVVVVVPLVCDAEVRTILLHPYQPGVLLGGTRSGRIVSWNFSTPWAGWSISQLVTRCTAATGTPHTLVLPSMRPSSSTFPSPGCGVLKMAILGEESAHQLHAIRVDGSVNTWSAHKTITPLSTRQAYQQYSPLGPIGTSAAFAVKRGAGGALTRVFVGTQHGTVLVGTPRDAKAVDYVPSSSSAGTTVASGSASGVSEREARAAADLKRGLGDHTGMIASVSRQAQDGADFLRDDASLLTCGVDGRALLWPQDGAAAPFSLAQNGVTAVTWSPVDSELFATGSDSGAISLWRLQSAVVLTPLVTLLPARPVECAHLSSAILVLSTKTRSREAGGRGTGVVSNGTGAAGRAGGAASEPNGFSTLTPVTTLQFSPDGQWLFAGYNSGSIVVIHLESDTLEGGIREKTVS